MIGRVLADRYRIVRRIGEGGMGAVYLCEHVVLHRPLAVKVLRRDLSNDPEIVERFRNEAIAASQIGQENVVDVFDIGKTDDGALYYVMEALEGRSVGAILRHDGPIAVPRALAVLEQVGRALGAAHARGVVHRDLKPDNVFLVRREDGSEQAKLLDFGISKVDQAGERLTQAGAIIGTPEYMAPEQAAGAAVDHRTDVYALGVMAYELLTGALPFEGDNAIATLVAHQTRPPEPPSRRRSGVPPDVDALVLRALAKRPEDRFDSMAELVAEVVRIRARLGNATPEPVPLPRRDPGVTPRLDLPPFRPSHRGGTVTLPPPSASGVRAPASEKPEERHLGARAVVLLALLLAVAAGAGWWLRGLGIGGSRPDWPGPFPAVPEAASASSAAAAPQRPEVPAGEPSGPPRPPEPA
ncbi:MAG TPA: serine/threonine-protein kinase, partial [Anaeromyxobacteraceae bacterium]|nr:serine/threonine-protein kinase [Anaeromyxobacteraceae bacterium]